MTVKDVIDLVEIKCKRSGIQDLSRTLVLEVIKLKYREFTAGNSDVSYTLVTDGNREYALPDGIRRVEQIFVDGYEAVATHPEVGDRSYEESLIP